MFYFVLFVILIIIIIIIIISLILIKNHLNVKYFLSVIFPFSISTSTVNVHKLGIVFIIICAYWPQKSTFK